MPIVKMNQAFVDGAKPKPNQARTEWVDKETPCLYLITTSTGRGSTFFYRPTINGEMKHIKLGRTSEITLQDARRKALEIRLSLGRGEDPTGEKNLPSSSVSLTRLFYDHFLPYAKPRLRSWNRYEQIFRCHLQPTLGDRDIRTITRRDLESLHTDLLNRGDLAVASVNHVAKLARRMLQCALQWEMVDRNVASRFAMTKTYNRVNHKLEPDQLKALVTNLNTHPNRMVSLVCLWALSTGARCGECRLAKFEQIDRENRTWTIPAVNAKGKVARTVPLGDIAVSIYDQCLEAKVSDFLFVSPRSGLPYTTISKSWDRIRKAAGLPNLLIHSLRREFASLLISSPGVSLFSVQTILGHRDPKTTMLYASVNNQVLQSAANQASIRIKEAMDQTAA